MSACVGSTVRSAFFRTGGFRPGRFSSEALVLLPLAVLGGCATTGATLGSGVGDRLLEHPPYYAGSSIAALDTTAPLAFFPVVYQPGATQPDIFDPDPSGEIAGLLAEMNSYLANTGAATALGGGSAPERVDLRHPPDVRFGCVSEPSDEADCEEGEGALGRGSMPMLLAVGRPSRDWVGWADSVMVAAGVEHVLVLTVEVGPYRIRQRGFRGTKEVELGTDHVARFPWLTSLEGQVSVLQVTGALVGRDGKAVRIGAEGLLARRTSMTVSVLGGQSLVTDDEIRDLRAQRREDLPGRPLVWQAGLRSLVEQLTGRSLPAMHVAEELR